MTYNDITILKFQEIQSAIAMNEDNEIAQWYNILPLLTDRTKEQYKLMPFGEFKKCVREFEWIMTEPMPDEWVRDFTVCGERYYVTQFATDWNTEQFISMSTLTRDRSQIINNLHMILAVLCYRERGELVDQTELERRATLFQENLCILTAYPIGFFFALLLAKLSEDTRFSLHLRRILSQTGSPKSGDGMRQSTGFLRRRLERILNSTTG